MPIEESITINLINAVSVIKNFVSKKFNVVVLYPISQKNYDFFVENLKGMEKIFVFTFNPNMEDVLKNRGERELIDWERERIKYHYSIGINNPSFGEIINNTNQTPEETAQLIIFKIPD